MALEKALIQPLDNNGGNNGEAVQVLFNPNEYSIEKSNQFQSAAIPGLSTPVSQFISGNAGTLTVDLFFDTYEKTEDVRNYTGKITALLDINSELHAPPVCKFVWGKLEFKAVIERISQKFTMFLDSGIPVRSTLNVTFKEYKTIEEQMKETPRNSSDRTKQRVVKQGDTLWQIAAREYGDPALWRHIAKANRIHNPGRLEMGTEIIIPPLD